MDVWRAIIANSSAGILLPDWSKFDLLKMHGVTLKPITWMDSFANLEEKVLSNSGVAFALLMGPFALSL